MYRVLCFFAIVAGVFISSSVQAQCQDIIDEVLADEICTKIRTYKSNNLSENPILLIALHGDSPFNNPSYHYKFAERIADKSNNLIAIGMLRPGYTDDMNRTSDGIKGDAVGDNYDKARVSQIANAIQQLESYYKPSILILAGHSGGSAITANLIALYPDLVDHAFIVSCPCNVNTWREDMYKLTKKPIFRGALETVSPVELVEHISRKIKITMFSGATDIVAKTELSGEYKSVLETATVDVNLHIIDGEHDIFLKNEVITSIVEIVGGYNKALQQKIR